MTLGLVEESEAIYPVVWQDAPKTAAVDTLGQGQ
jgi:hypothetical protein